MNAIEVQGLYKKVGNFQLKNIHLQVEQGTVMGLIGQNGAGKTTLIKCLLNMLKITLGQVTIFGRDHITDEVAIKEDIGVVFDELQAPDSFTAGDLEKFYRRVYKNWDESLFFHYLERFDVPKYTKISKLSRGMKMKLAIILALSHHPKLLLLDEPTGGLDPVVRDEILDVLLDFMEDETHTILFSSHITSDLEKIADSVTFIHKGEIQWSETKDTLLYDYGIWKGSKLDAKQLPEKAIISSRVGVYGMDVLVNRQYLRGHYTLEQPTIEDIMVFSVKGELRDALADKAFTE